MKHSMYENTTEEIKLEYTKAISPWLLAYSGGKDSSTVLKLLVQALTNATDLNRPVYIVFCDTGIENPIVYDFVRYTFKQVNLYVKQNNLPITTYILRPKKKDCFWVKVIGRG